MTGCMGITPAACDASREGLRPSHGRMRQQQATHAEIAVRNLPTPSFLLLQIILMMFKVRSVVTAPHGLNLLPGRTHDEP